MENQGFDKFTSVEERDIEQIFQPSKQTKSNIPPATITEDTTLATIFLFDIDNLNTHSLFSRAAINQNKPIMALYTDARCDLMFNPSPKILYPITKLPEPKKEKELLAKNMLFQEPN
ncbi:hypothetical protein G9A89_017333 [Geosiphon pyriformis]|nr:hypothetical protein G9A89_017333 [Geosiphon pyriformis]